MNSRYAKDYWTGQQNSFTALFVSRKPFDHLLEGEEWNITKQIENLKGKGINLGFLQLWNERLSEENQQSFESAMPFFADLIKSDEKILAAYLSLLSQGHIPAKSISPIAVDSGS